MAFYEKREIAEMISLYSLEPRIRDVFVEGPTDQRILSWFLHESKQDATGVHEVDSVNIPADLVHNYGMDATSKRCRQIALAKELERALGQRDTRVSVLIDSDFDFLLGNIQTCTLIISTDYANMEMYFYNIQGLGKLLTLLIGNFPKRPKTVLGEITEPLQELFLVRLTSSVLGWALGTVRLERCCAIANGRLRFDRDLYIRRVLISGGKANQSAEFLATLERHRCLLKSDPRFQIHGHDFIELLAWYIRNHGRPNSDAQTLGKTWPLCLDLNDMRRQNLFQSILERVEG